MVAHTTADDKASQTPPAPAPVCTAPHVNGPLSEKKLEQEGCDGRNGDKPCPSFQPAQTQTAPAPTPENRDCTTCKNQKEDKKFPRCVQCLAFSNWELAPTPPPVTEQPPAEATNFPPPLQTPPPPPTPLTKQELKELLTILDHSLDEYLNVRNGIARLLGMEARVGPVSPVAPAPAEPAEPISTDSMMERAEHHRNAVREEINRGRVPVAKSILETYGPRWAWKPSELSIQSAIKQVLAGKRQAAAPAPLGAPTYPPAQTQGNKPASAQDAILKVLSGGAFMAYKPLLEKVQSLGFTAEQFSDAYSNLTSMNLVVEESLDKIRKA